MSTREPTPEDLLGHVDWVRALARRLVGDASLAEDIAQETWLAASQARHERPVNLRAWLAGIARNRARMAGRSGVRRRAREAAAARPEAQESTAELAERASLQKDLLGRVLELEEPLRAVVLLRFFDELKPNAIAKRLGIPVKTVHSRLERALGRLRVRLDSEYGDRSAWALAFVPLLRAPAGASTLALAPVVTTLLGAAVKSNSIAVAVCAAVLVGGYGLYTALESDAGPEAASPGQGVAALERPAVEVEAQDEPEAVGDREAVPAGTAAEVASEAKSPVSSLADPRFPGRLLDVTGRPVAGVEVFVACLPDVPLGVSDAQGAFELVVPAEGSRAALLSHGDNALLVHDESWVALRATTLGRSRVGDEQLVVVAPAVRFDALVVSADGAPMAGANLMLNSFDGGLHEFPHTLEQTTWIELSGTSGEDGRVELPRFPDARGQSVHISAEGYRGRWIDLDEETQPYVFELRRLADDAELVVEGIVLTVGGFPAAGALVRCGNEETVSGPEGRFALPLRRVPKNVPLVAAAKGHLPGLIPEFARHVEEHGAGRVELVLGPEPVVLEGRVVDEEGHPLAGWEVSVVDELEVSWGRIPVESAESMARGLETDLDKVSRERRRTDRDGRFRLRGLYPRSYTLQAVDKTTLTRARRTVEAGAGEVELRVAIEFRGPIAGRVVDRDGVPIAGVEVQIGQTTFENEMGSQSIQGDATTTDEEGRFELGRAPAVGGHLGWSGPDVMFGSEELDDVGDLSAVELRVARRRHFRIELGDPSRANRFSMLDAEGGSVQINRIQAYGMSSFSHGDLVGGRSEPLSISDEAAWIVLWREDEEVGRERVRFGSEELTVLSF